jgi:uncharacterized protein (DUF2235 family)
MAKNIVLCSDGTGNAGGQLRGTNVWRLFQAVDHDPPGPNPRKQIAMHDDGVGSEDFKLIRIIGGAFGWGITRNLEELYGYLVRHFDPGDDIYLFGFSRGAFTVRALANILYYCGIADRQRDENGVRVDRTPEELDELVHRAVLAYKRRRCGHPDAYAAPYQFRTTFGRPVLDAHGRELPHRRGRFPIKFVGIWDTVDAVGLPIDELTQAFLRLRIGSWRLFGLNLRRLGDRYDRPGEEWENDFHPLIEHGCHAIAVDDERHTFHPVLWIEPFPTTAAIAGLAREKWAQRGRPVNDDRLDWLEAEAELRAGRNPAPLTQTIEQVWFAGMHGNVGGGYAKDQLSLVALDWMMDRAHDSGRGLQFHQAARQQIRREMDPLGKLYDSRSGPGVYYRYRPRHLGEICDQVGIHRPTIHAAVLERIAAHTDDYAPTGIPQQYDVVDHRAGAAVPRESNAAGRMRYEDKVNNRIWGRRVLYYTFLAWSILALFVSAKPDALPDRLLEFDVRCYWPAWAMALGLFAVGSVASVLLSWRRQSTDLVDSAWQPVSTVVWKTGALGSAVLAFHQPLTALLRWVAPASAEPLIDTLATHPTLLLAITLITYWIQSGSTSLCLAIHGASVAAWRVGLGGQPAPPPAGPLGHLTRWGRAAYGVRHKLDWLDLLKDRVAPGLFALAVLLSGSIALVRQVRSATECTIPTQPREEVKRQTLLREVAFDTTQYACRSGVVLEPGREYVIVVSPDVPASAVTPAARRAAADGGPDRWNWTDATLPATPDGLKSTPLKLHFFSPLRRVASQPWFRLMGSVGDYLIPIGTGSRFRMPSDEQGELVLFVNDAPCCYGNNQGKARVCVYRLD